MVVISVVRVVVVGKGDPSRLHFGGRGVGKSTKDGEKITCVEGLLDKVVSNNEVRKSQGGRD